MIHRLLEHEIQPNPQHACRHTAPTAIRSPAVTVHPSAYGLGCYVYRDKRLHSLSEDNISFSDLIQSVSRDAKLAGTSVSENARQPKCAMVYTTTAC